MLRQINLAGLPAYQKLMAGGLYQKLTSNGLLIKHKEQSVSEKLAIIQPEIVPVITYPYEWSFAQLQDAALATLEVQRQALNHQLSLRDASAYNIQWLNGRPVLIDTSSFEEYKPGQPWQAYKQFCQHFLAPLALASYVDPDLILSSRLYIDGIPLPLAARLLPTRAWVKPGLLMHLRLHAGFQKRHETKTTPTERTVSKSALLGMLDNLDKTIRSLRPARRPTQWGDYYEHTNYDDEAVKSKSMLLERFIKQVKPKRVVDLGGNNGFYSRLALPLADTVVSADVDPLAVDQNYRQMKAARETNLWPMVVDLTNPSPSQGWAGQERQSFSQRASGDMVLALALVHHLAIGNNVPLALVAQYLAKLGPWLVIEFVPKSDTQVKRLLATREDIFSDYSEVGFVAAFSDFYSVEASEKVMSSERTMFLMKRRDGSKT